MASGRLAIVTATAAEAERVEASLGDFTVLRDGVRLAVTDAERGEPMFGPLLRALEECLTAYELHPIKVELDGRRYMMYARADA